MTEKALEGIVLSRSKRFINLLIDIFVYLGVIFLLSVFLFIITFPIDLNPESLNSFLVEYIIPYSIIILSYTLQEFLLKGRTIGKYVTGSIAVDNKGDVIDFNKAIYRSICRLIPFDALTYLRESKRGLHDIITETYVVDKKAWEELKNNDYEIDQIGKTEN